MDLKWRDEQYKEVLDDDLQHTTLGQWITVTARTLKRKSGLPCSLMLRFETPDRLVLWFEDEKGHHGRIRPFVIERTQFEIDEQTQATIRELNKHFTAIESM